MSIVNLLPRPNQVGTLLPSPPTDAEKYWYMGRQHRWLLLFQAMSFGLVAYSVVRFSIVAIPLLIFVIPLSLYLISLVVSLFSSTRTKRTSEPDHDLRVTRYVLDRTPPEPEPQTTMAQRIGLRPPPLPALMEWPSVDVLLPSAGEDLVVLDNTFNSVYLMDHQGPLNVYVLDDSARPEVRTLARLYGFHYLTRPDRGVFKKAGNLKYGYDRSDGDFLIVFDADFCPRPDFLANTLPYFEDEHIGIVQTPQFFDTDKSMGWIQRCAGATQELFYRWIQPGRDRSNAAICVGTNAVYRRAGLIKSGGFAQIGHSEDVHTGVNLMRVGYYVRYVPIILAKGICPDTTSGFLNQQYRWCTGSMSLLADPTFHANEHIGFRQRMSFWAGFLYYISTALNAFTAPIPGLVMAWVLPQYVFPINSIWLLGAISLWLVVLPLTMHSRWRIDVLRVQVMYSFAHAIAIFDIVRGKTKGWVATGAHETGPGSTSIPVAVGRVMKTYVLLTQIAIIVGLFVGTVHYGLHNFWAMWALAVVSLYIHVPLLFVKIAGKK